MNFCVLKAEIIVKGLCSASSIVIFNDYKNVIEFYNNLFFQIQINNNGSNPLILDWTSAILDADKIPLSDESHITIITSLIPESESSI